MLAIDLNLVHSLSVHVGLFISTPSTMVDLSQAPMVQGHHVVLSCLNDEKSLNWVLQVKRYFYFYSISNDFKLPLTSVYLDGNVQVKGSKNVVQQKLFATSLFKGATNVKEEMVPAIVCPILQNLTHRMDSEHLGKVLSNHLEFIIRSRVLSLQILINQPITELEIELSCLGKHIIMAPRINSEILTLKSHLEYVASSSMTQVWDPGRKWCIHSSILLSDFALEKDVSDTLQLKLLTSLLFGPMSEEYTFSSCSSLSSSQVVLMNFSCTRTKVFYPQTCAYYKYSLHYFIEDFNLCNAFWNVFDEAGPARVLQVQSLQAEIAKYLCSLWMQSRKSNRMTILQHRRKPRLAISLAAIMQLLWSLL